MSLLRDKYGPRALVTGAGAGIGAAFTSSLSDRGFDLTLVDIDGEALERAARGPRAEGRDVRLVTADLTLDHDLARVEPLLDDERIGLVINNAGISHMGHFTEVPVSEHERAMSLNCRATLRLTHRAACRFRRAGRGGIVIISSNSGLLHSPFVANYAGTKAYGLALGEALYTELRPHGVDVLAVVAGLTRTPGLEAAGVDEGMAGSLMVDARVVAEGALAALGKGPRHIPNVRDRLGAMVLAGLPRRAALSLNALTMRKLFPGLARR